MQKREQALSNGEASLADKRKELDVDRGILEKDRNSVLKLKKEVDSKSSANIDTSKQLDERSNYLGKKEHDLNEFEAVLLQKQKNIENRVSEIDQYFKDVDTISNANIKTKRVNEARAKALDKREDDLNASKERLAVKKMKISIDREKLEEEIKAFDAKQ